LNVSRLGDVGLDEKALAARVLDHLDRLKGLAFPPACNRNLGSLGCEGERSRPANPRTASRDKRDFAVE
jgi:hypothetical protein